MFSASPSPAVEATLVEKPDAAFIGIDPDDVLVVKKDGAEFTLGVLPVGLWDIISSRHGLAFQESRRRAIRSLADKGLDPEEIVDGYSRVLTATTLDPTFRQEKFAVQIDAIRFGLRLHSAFVNKAGKTFPFTQEKKSIEGIECLVVAENTLRVYRANPQLVAELYQALKQLNELGGLAKKV